VIWHPPRYLVPTAPDVEGRGDPAILAIRATLDGSWVTATFDTATPGAPAEGRVSWFDTGPDDRFAQLRAPASLTPSARTRLLLGPVRVGRRMLVPVDDGFLVVPLEPRAPR